MSAEALNVARKNLTEALGDKTKAYFEHMKMWFKMKIDKEEFDAEARTLLSADLVHLHNEFFLAILNKVDGLAEIASMASAQERSSSRGRRHNRDNRDNRHPSDRSNFEAVDLLDYIPPGSPPGSPPGPGPARYAAQDLFLPDHALVTGRFMLTAWEQGLDGADDDTVDLIVAAAQAFLKNVLSAVITQRKGYRVRDGNFVHDIGGGASTDAPSDAAPPAELDADGEAAPARPMTIDEAELATARRIARGDPHQTTRKDRISMQEVYDTLKVHKNVIASHSVYAVNMERMASLLCHPSY